LPSWCSPPLFPPKRIASMENFWTISQSLVLSLNNLSKLLWN
jgi:hypothetical protein